MEEKRPQDITSVERIKRVSEVKELLIKGASRGQIMQFCAENYKTNERVVDDYIHDAKDEIKQYFNDNFDKDYIKANLIERLEDLYRNNLDMDDFRECRNVIKDLRDILGLDEAKKIVNNNININQDVTPISFVKSKNDKDK